ncbi:MAG: hypothetical protein KBC56_06110 [Flavobacterium sp.]|nr:hypothetical protein [Flavobacterium sp.]
MKNSAIRFGLFSIILLGVISCKDKEQELADNRINELESYVDSLKTVSAEERQANWEQITADYEARKASADDALASLDEDKKAASEEKLNASNAKYDEYRIIALANAEPAKPQRVSSSQLLRDRLFGAGKIGSDMSFAWVNKDNILTVYQNFFDAYKQNKSEFTREDYDEIKLMYEALDTRKNTVEKEGLSSDDNGKIATIKFKLAPMFKVNRIGAKSRENEEAKE